ncbi:hypothetical protein CBR_g53608 [Chara braunii]|uniref:Uncharacterized protein n=1 Tax=Chara braunii TaxID=69332 RepID=A0A388MB70_CHABU|nr:hypothetical protein CBR_g53608 [Chara braunii]|eukprot:GBG91755.1 hypothetical protein CBR_g53608 [Chara braunii]
MDDSHLEGRVPETRMGGPDDAQDNRTALCDDLAIEEEERNEMERVIAAIKATTQDSPPASSKKGGLNHLPCMALDVDEAIPEQGKFLDELFARIMELRDLTDSTGSFLRRVILKKGKEKMERYQAAHRHIVAEPFEHPTVKRELAFLTGRFLICPMDKAPNMPAFVFKNFKRKMAFQRLSGLEFASIPAPPAVVISRIRGELLAFPALPAAVVSYPYLMAVLKVQKGTFRWITNTANTVIFPAADICACILRFLLPLVQTFCQNRSLEVEEQHGVKPNLWWAISTVGEFYTNLPEKVYSVFTADMTRCFETIPTDNSEDSLTAAVKFNVQCAMQVMRERCFNHAVMIRFGEGGDLQPAWADVELPEEMGTLLFREGDICWLSEWCIANSILYMGEYVWRQVHQVQIQQERQVITTDYHGTGGADSHAMLKSGGRGESDNGHSDNDEKQWLRCGRMMGGGQEDPSECLSLSAW